MVLHLTSGGAVAPAWQSAARPQFPILSDNVKADVAIIGGGIAGLCAALDLSERGYKVALVERSRLGEGSTGWCAGILSNSTTVDLQMLQRAFGSKIADRIARSVVEALDRYSKLFAEAQWQTGSTLYLAARARHLHTMYAESATRAAYHLPTKLLSQVELDGTLRGFHGAVQAAGEHATNPMALVGAIAERLHASGVGLFENSPASSWDATGGRIRVRTPNGTIEAKHLVLAGGLSGMSEAERRLINRFLIPVAGRVLVTKPSEVVAQMVRDRQVIAAWDSLHLYHYVRYMADGRMLVGGEEAAGDIASTALPADSEPIRRLHQWAKEHHSFPVPDVESAWQASLIFPADGLPFVQTNDFDGAKVITLVTDGLPFAFTLGPSVANIIETGSDWLADCLAPTRRMPLHARLASILPAGKLRSLAHRAVVKAIEFYDWLR